MLYAHLCLGIPSGLFRLLSYVFCVKCLSVFLLLGLMILITSDVVYKVLSMSLSTFPATVLQYSVLSHLQSITITFCWNVAPFGRCQCLEEIWCFPPRSVIAYNCNTPVDNTTIYFINSLVFSLRGRAGRNQSPVMWPVWLWHTASWASSWV